jgi:hypothetical protein
MPWIAARIDIENSMWIYRFTLVLDASELTEDLADALFQAGCDDGSPGQCNGVVTVEFDREAASLEEAIRSAIAAVNAAGSTVSRVEIQPDQMVATLP